MWLPLVSDGLHSHNLSLRPSSRHRVKPNYVKILYFYIIHILSQLQQVTSASCSLGGVLNDQQTLRCHQLIMT